MNLKVLYFEAGNLSWSGSCSFVDILSHDMIQKLLNGMNVFLVSRSREVVKATLGFIKVG